MDEAVDSKEEWRGINFVQKDLDKAYLFAHICKMDGFIPSVKIEGSHQNMALSVTVKIKGNKESLDAVFKKFFDVKVPTLICTYRDSDEEEKK